MSIVRSARPAFFAKTTELSSSKESIYFDARQGRAHLRICDIDDTRNRAVNPAYRREYIAVEHNQDATDVEVRQP